MAKRIVIIVCFMCMSNIYAHAQIIYGIKLAGGLAYQQVTNATIIGTGSVKTFNATAIAQLPLKKQFWLSGGIGITNKGSVVYVDALTTFTHLTYLEVPVNVLRKFDFGNTGVVYVGAGGYVAMGLKGHLDYETPGSNTSDILRFGKENDLKKMDAGINFLTGLELKNNLTFNVAYSLGLNNIASLAQQDSGTGVVKNRIFTIGLGYLIK